MKKHIGKIVALLLSLMIVLIICPYAYKVMAKPQVISFKVLDADDRALSSLKVSLRDDNNDAISIESYEYDVYTGVCKVGISQSVDIDTVKIVVDICGEEFVEKYTNSGTVDSATGSAGVDESTAAQQVSQIIRVNYRKLDISGVHEEGEIESSQLVCGGGESILSVKSNISYDSAVYKCYKLLDDGQLVETTGITYENGKISASREAEIGKYVAVMKYNVTGPEISIWGYYHYCFFDVRSNLEVNFSSETVGYNESKDIPVSVICGGDNHDKVYYESYDTSIATVNGTGKVTGKKVGQTTIRAYTDYDVELEYVLNVVPATFELDYSAVPNSYVSGDRITFYNGELSSVTVKPNNRGVNASYAIEKSGTTQCDATVDTTGDTVGKVTGFTPGVYYITVSDSNGNYESKTYSIDVKSNNISVDQNSIVVKKGNTEIYKDGKYTKNSYRGYNVSFSKQSDNEYRITVKRSDKNISIYVPAVYEKNISKKIEYKVENGQIQTTPSWIELIGCESKVLYINGIDNSIKVTVETVKSTEEIHVAPSSNSIMYGMNQSIKTNAYINDEMNNFGGFTYYSDKPSVAEVDQFGNVTAKGVGKATITVSAESKNLNQISYEPVSYDVTVVPCKVEVAITEGLSDGRRETDEGDRICVNPEIKYTASYKVGDEIITLDDMDGITYTYEVYDNNMYMYTATLDANSNYSLTEKDSDDIVRLKDYIVKVSFGREKNCNYEVTNSIEYKLYVEGNKTYYEDLSDAYTITGIQGAMDNWYSWNYITVKEDGTYEVQVPTIKGVQNAVIDEVLSPTQVGKTEFEKDIAESIVYDTNNEYDVQENKFFIWYYDVNGMQESEPVREYFGIDNQKPTMTGEVDGLAFRNSLGMYTGQDVKVDLTVTETFMYKAQMLISVDDGATWKSYDLEKSSTEGDVHKYTATISSEEYKNQIIEVKFVAYDRAGNSVEKTLRELPDKIHHEIFVEKDSISSAVGKIDEVQLIGRTTNKLYIDKTGPNVDLEIKNGNSSALEKDKYYSKNYGSDGNLMLRAEDATNNGIVSGIHSASLTIKNSKGEVAYQIELRDHIDKGYIYITTTVKGQSANTSWIDRTTEGITPVLSGLVNFADLTEDGEYTAVFWAKDRAGNEDTKEDIRFYVDNTAPKIDNVDVSVKVSDSTLNVTDAVVYANNNLVFKVKASDASGIAKVYMFLTNDSGTEEMTGSLENSVYTFEVPVNKQGTVSFMVIDNAIGAYVVNTESDEPGAAFGGNRNTKYMKDVDDKDKYNTSVILTENHKPTVNVNVDEVKWINANSLKDASFTVSVIDDKDASNNPLLSSTISYVVITVTNDKDETTEIKVEGINAATWNATYDIKSVLDKLNVSENGIYNIKAVAYDKSGNWEVDDKKSFKADLEAPTADDLYIVTEENDYEHYDADYSYFNKAVKVELKPADTQGSGYSTSQLIMVKSADDESRTIVPTKSDKTGVIGFDIPVNMVGEVSVILTDVAGNSRTYKLSEISEADGQEELKSNNIMIEANKPVITIEPSRPTDANNKWYKDPLTYVVNISEPVTDASAPGINYIQSGLKNVSFKINGVDIGMDVDELGKIDAKLYEIPLSEELIQDERIINDDGSYTLTVETQDYAGNTNTETKIVYVDIVDPSVDIITDTENDSSNQGSVKLEFKYVEKHYTEVGNLMTVNVIRTLDGVETKEEYTYDNIKLVETEGFPVVLFSEDGRYEVTVNYTDAAGRLAETKTIKFELDNTKPVITLSGADNNQYYQGAINLGVNVVESHYDFMEVTVTATKELNGATETIGLEKFEPQAKSTDKVYVFAAEGTYTVTVNAKDRAGNDAEPKNIVFTVDNENPSVEFVGVEDHGTYAGEFVPVININDNYYAGYNVSVVMNGITYDENNRAVYSKVQQDVTAKHSGLFVATATGGSLKFTTFAKERENEGIYTVTVTARDKANRSTTKVVKFAINRYGSVYTFDDALTTLLDSHVTSVDEDVVITEYNANRLVADSIKLQITRDGSPMDDVKYEVSPLIKDDNDLGASGWYQYDYKISKENFAKDGVYSITLASKDAAGNVSETDSYENLGIQFRVDTTVPELSMVQGLEKKIRNAENITVNYSVFDAIGIKEVVVYVNDAEVQKITEFDDVTSYEGSFVIGEGSNQKIRFVVTDCAGNITDTNDEALYNSGKVATFERQITVSTNMFIRLWADKPMFIGVVAGMTAILSGLIVLVAKKRKKEN